MIITFDLDAISSRTKKDETVEGYLNSRGSVDKYLDIMANVDPSDKNFQDKFKKFYGLRLSKTQLDNFFKTFDVYFKKSKPLNYREILTDLADKTTGTGQIEKSFGSKLLHTLDPNEPIIDKQVIEKLRSCPQTEKYFKKVPKIIKSIDDAVALHNALKDCYNGYLIPQAKKANYFDEFDRRFPSAKDISEIKKIDFYLWAM